MPTIAVLGATGYVGRLVVRELASQRHRVLGVVRERTRGSDLLEDDTGIVLRTADATSTAELTEALEGSDLAIGAVGPLDGSGRGVFRAAIEAGVHLVDLTGLPAAARVAFEERDVEARAAGVTIVPGATAVGVVGDLLAGVAAGAVSGPTDVHVVSTTLGDRGRPSTWPPSLWTPGQRREHALQVGEQVHAWVEGELREESPAEHRRLAWFPRPVGPAHAASEAGTHALTVPRHVHGVRTVRSYQAIPGWRAELLQLQGSLARHDLPRKRRIRRLRRTRPSPSPSTRAARRWAMVVEAANAAEHARAWANGRDLDRVAVIGAILMSESILAGHADTGVLPPSCVEVPHDLLDRMSSSADLRWSVVRPAR